MFHSRPKIWPHVFESACSPNTQRDQISKLSSSNPWGWPLHGLHADSAPIRRHTMDAAREPRQTITLRRCTRECRRRRMEPSRGAMGPPGFAASRPPGSSTAQRLGAPGWPVAEAGYPWPGGASVGWFTKPWKEGYNLENPRWKVWPTFFL